jgi:uncharacterized protein (DUF362 family)
LRDTAAPRSDRGLSNESAMSTVAITQDRDDIGRAIAEGLSHMPLERLVRGRLVAVKPNDTWASPDDTTAVTQPDTLRDYYGHPRGNGRRHDNAFFDDMHSFIAAMYRRFPIHLAITVAHPAMVATGPIGGHVAETGLAITSTDALAADVVGARLLGFEPQAVRHLSEADLLGLGESDTDRMTFPAMELQAAIEAFTERVYGKRLTFEHS